MKKTERKRKIAHVQKKGNYNDDNNNNFITYIAQITSAYDQMRITYLTIIPRARMGSESIAHEAEGRIGY